MKKIKLLLLGGLICASSTLFSQRLGAEAGANFYTQTFSDDDGDFDEDVETLIGFHVRGVFEIGVSDALSVQVGLGISNKGFKISEDDPDFSYKFKASLYYLDVPVLVKYGIALGDSKLYIGAGPNLGYGIAGKFKSESTFDGNTQSDSEDIDFGTNEDEDDYKPFDLGVKAVAGLDFNGLYFQAGYELGLINISPYVKYGYRVTNRGFSITIGYMIGD